MNVKVGDIIKVKNPFDDKTIGIGIVKDYKKDEINCYAFWHYETDKIYSNKIRCTNNAIVIPTDEEKQSFLDKLFNQTKND